MNWLITIWIPTAAVVPLGRGALAQGTVFKPTVVKATRGDKPDLLIIKVPEQSEPIERRRVDATKVDAVGRGPVCGPGPNWVQGCGGRIPCRSKPQILYSPKPHWTEESDEKCPKGRMVLKILETPHPGWTLEAERAGFEGQVILSVTFGADGLLRNIRVLRGLGSGLDEKAIVAAKQIRFRPAIDLSDNPTDWRGLIRIMFYSL